MSKTNVSSLVDFVDPSVTDPKDFLKIYGYGYKALSVYLKPFKELGAHAKLRDRLFTFFLIKDIRERSSYNYAMGRESLRHVNKVTYRGLQMGGFLNESSEMKYRKIVSLVPYLDKLLKYELQLKAWLNEPGKKDALSGLNERVDPFDKNGSDRKVNLINWLSRYLISSPLDYTEASVFSCYRPFVYEINKTLDRINEIREKIWTIQDKLYEVEGSDYVGDIITIERDINSLTTSPYTGKKDPLLNSEWSSLLRFFHKFIDVKKHR